MLIQIIEYSILDGICPMDEFYCGNRTCIPIGWACDGIDDCGNNRDETENCILGMRNFKNIYAEK